MKEIRLNKIIESLKGPSLLLCGTSASYIYEQLKETIEEIETGRDTSFDVLVIQPSAGNIGIDEIRELIEFILTPPVYTTRRYGIVMEADRLTLQAANAFLKALEEHRADSVIALISQRCDELLETVKSRCFRVNFPYPVERVQKLLKNHEDLKVFKALILKKYEVLRFLEGLTETPREMESLIRGCKLFETMENSELLSKSKELIDADREPLKNELLFHCWFKELIKRLSSMSRSEQSETLSKLSKVKKAEFLKLVVNESTIFLREFALAFGSSAWHLSRSPDILKDIVLLDHELDMESIAGHARWFVSVSSRKVENLNNEAAIFAAFLRILKLLRGERNA
ncbi:MAG TPA: hypothetical protein DHV12_01430 [Thermotogae bacterium]|nr:polymerase subunit delta [Thermotogota bacterium]HCZ05792.1 hypothetical protein [Thermotogota bacterium]